MLVSAPGTQSIHIKFLLFISYIVCTFAFFDSLKWLKILQASWKESYYISSLNLLRRYL